MLNNIIKFFSWAHFTFFSHGWIHRPTRTFFPRYYFAVVAIFFYCSVELCFASYEEPKFFNSAFDFSYGVGNYLEGSLIPILRDRIEPLQLSKHTVSENVSGLIKSFFISMLSGDDAGEQSGEQNRKSPEQIFSNHVFILITLLCVLWLGIGMPFYLLFFT